jgi:hypothetical protein
MSQHLILKKQQLNVSEILRGYGKKFKQLNDSGMSFEEIADYLDRSM